VSAIVKFSIALVFAIFPVVATGCGSSDGSAEAAEEFTIKKGSVGHCLLKAGAERATTASDLDFLSEAESDDEVSKVAFAFDRRARLFVNVWTGSSLNNRPPPWVVWFAQPFDEDISTSPIEMIRSGQPKSYVMYLNNPSLSERNRAEACITVGSGKSRVPHPLR
jgi:hypothetical protein